MSLHDPLSPPTVARPNPGGATVADLRTLDGAQALTVMLLRDWFDGPDGRTRVGQTFEGGLGRFAGPAALEAWEAFMDMLSQDARRSVMRHDIACRCVGADEAVLAQVLTLAGRGAREDAMLVLSLLLPGDRLLIAVHSAERAGLALMRMALRDRRMVRGPAPGPRRLH